MDAPRSAPRLAKDSDFLTYRIAIEGEDQPKNCINSATLAPSIAECVASVRRKVWGVILSIPAALQTSASPQRMALYSMGCAPFFREKT